MPTKEQSEMARAFRDGWVVVGYSTTIMAAGAMTHSVLMQKDAQLATVTTVVNNGKEIGRTTTWLAE